MFRSVNPSPKVDPTTTIRFIHLESTYAVLTLHCHSGVQSTTAGIYVKPHNVRPLHDRKDQGYGRGGTPIFTDMFEPLARVALYPTNEDGLGTRFGAA